MATAAERKRKSRVAGSNREKETPAPTGAKPGQIRISPPVLIRERLNVDPGRVVVKVDQATSEGLQFARRNSSSASKWIAVWLRAPRVAISIILGATISVAWSDLVLLFVFACIAFEK